jgi:hypothetical protein
VLNVFTTGSAYDPAAKTATRSYIEPVVKTFNTMDYSCYCSPSGFERAVKCVTAGSHINDSESLGGDQTFYSSVTFTNYTTLDLSKKDIEVPQLYLMFWTKNQVF